MPKVEIYRWVKIVGMVSFIPVILAAGPLTGYFAGEYLEKKLSVGPFVVFISIGIGSMASIVEVVRIIRLVLKIEKKH